MSIAVRKRAGSGRDAARGSALPPPRRRRRGPPRLAAGRLARRQVRPRGGPHLPHRASRRWSGCRSTSTAPTAAAGLTTGTFVSGYQGSPLGGLDQELARNRELRRRATTSCTCPASTRSSAPPSVWGSQLADQLPGAEYDGVLGIWYGKAPGPRPRRRRAPPRATSPASPRTGGVLRSSATTRAASPRRCPSAVRVAARRACTCRSFYPGQRAGGPRPRPARARLLARLRAVGAASRSSRTSPTRSAPPTVAPDRVDAA